jgi:organic radical activating enzyme
MFNIHNFKPGQKNEEVKNIIFNLSQYEKLEDLPQVETGCDTYYAIYPEFKRFSQDMSVHDVYQEILSRCFPSNVIGLNKKQPDLVITGGEPLLHQRGLINLFSKTLLLDTIQNITFETNGTQILKQELQDFISSSDYVQWTFSVSPKLYNSGHSRMDTLYPDTLYSYQQTYKKHVRIVLKFVISFDENIEQTKQDCLDFIKEYKMHDVLIDEVCIMPEGAVYDEHYKHNARECVNWCMEMGFRYSPRLQVELFDNGVGT